MVIRRARSALLFVAIGLAIYAALYGAAERLLHRTGHANALFKIATAEEPAFDWVILGASHAMPLGFGDFNAQMERATGLRILNLASPGTGPLYNRFVLESFLRGHRARSLLYVLDSFAFYSRAWNEDRFADAKLLRRTPFEAATARLLWRYAARDGVEVRAVLDYVTGFSKVNDRERFQRDVWEGEAQFERVYRTSASAVAKRIAYLYPAPPSPRALERYLAELSSAITVARQAGTCVVAIKMPLPSSFRSKLPEEDAFDAAVSRLLAERGAPFHDFSCDVDEARFYSDTDHLNRSGVSAFFARDLEEVLRAGCPR